MTTAPHAKGLPGWVELTVDNAEAAAEFYAALFGWSIQLMDPVDDFQYRIIMNGGKTIGGLMGKANDYQPTQWLTYFETDKLEETIDAVKANGGAVYMDPMPMPGGRFTVASDPAGAPIGLMESDNANDSYGEANGLTWYELEVADREKLPVTVDFYREVFDWATDEQINTEDMTYTTFGKNHDEQVGGIFGGQEFPGYLNNQSQWAVTFAVDDVDAMADKAKALGASVEGVMKDTPYGNFAMLRDPQGAFFVIMKANEQ